MTKLYLFSWINFGKYRTRPSKLKDILDTSEGRDWFRWINDHSFRGECDPTVLEYLELQEENARYVFPTVGS